MVCLSVCAVNRKAHAMIKPLRPYVGPGIGFLIGIALEVSPLQSAWLSGFIFGFAALWLVVAILDSAGIAGKWPGLLPYMPFLDDHGGSVMQPRQLVAQLKSAVNVANDRNQQLERQLIEEREAKPPRVPPNERPTASDLAERSEHSNGNQSQLQLARSLLLDRAKYGRDPKTRAELRVWMKGSADLVDGIISHRCPHKFKAGYPHGDHPLNEQDEGCRQSAMTSLRIIATNLREEHLRARA
jgi:hypothetical protein